MDDAATPRPRKRRAINACTACRVSKVKCDGDVNRPCQRCVRNRIRCQYHELTKDSNVLRIERLEDEVASLRAAFVAQKPAASLPSMESPQGMLLGHKVGGVHASSTSIPSISSSTRETDTQSRGIPSAVEKGLIAWEQASACFFSGSHYLVPVFTESEDTFLSVAERSAFLLDAIVSVGCRAEEGFSSSTYHRMQSHLREHLTSILINTAVPPSIEIVQAVAVMASFSENGVILVAIALRFAMALRLPEAVERLMTVGPRRSGETSGEETALYRLARVWYGVCNLELFFSLDGGKLPGINLCTSSRRIRALVNHRDRTPVDVRLFSQIELNLIRANAYSRIARIAGKSIVADSEYDLSPVIQETTIELRLWLDEWLHNITFESRTSGTALALLNLRIQYEWAVVTLHLKALAESGIENIALMDDFQRTMVCTAKDAAVRHLRYLLQDSSSPPSNTSMPTPVEPGADKPSTYLSTFKYTMDYVWAKCAFSVLLVLKLALLLQDPPSELFVLLHDAHMVLEELKLVTVGHVAYFQILQTSIEKCEEALKDYTIQNMNSDELGVGASGAEAGNKDTSQVAENVFQGYAPSKFVFEWDFPGLNLRHMPLTWQDLFVDFDTVF